ncbi:MAG: oxygen-independent coproporphyrinogen III oxidase [Pseudomonadota bacterium]
MSVYLHLPFCDRLCWFCGCHTKHTLKYEPIARYCQSLVKELALLAEELDFKPRLGQLHLGGGSPSLLRGEELDQIRTALDLVFELDGDSEVSVEVDPSDVEELTISALMKFGTTRVSIGVQDFSSQVQAAINRPQTFEITRDVVHAFRDAGIGSINIDALYGLPLQSESRLLQTLEQRVRLNPDRMALFGYAHVPWLKKHQRMIRSEDLPGVTERFEHAQSAAALLVDAGYAQIGIDHFARPVDSLCKAAREGALRRNFQGYTTDGHKAMFGLGASSIGRFAVGFVQNTVATNQYEAEIASGQLPKAKGLKLSDEDMLRGDVIERLMCDFSVDFSKLEHPVHLVEQCLAEARGFTASNRFDLCSMDGTVFEIREAAKPFARIIASRFDAYYWEGEFQYSKAV